MKAKFLATLSILVFVLASLAGCGSTSNEVESTEIASEATTTSEASHEHNYTETITVEATCETDGEATYTCDCGDTYTEAIDKITNLYTANTATTVTNNNITYYRDTTDLLIKSGMNAEKLQQFSNMCKNMEKVGTEGLNAKKQLMIVDECSQLSPQEKEQRICQFQLMNMVEKAMVNSAYSSYLQKNNANTKSSTLFNAMQKDPKVFEDELYRGIKMLESTEELKDMTPEEIAVYISEPEKVRQTLDEEVAKGAMKNREQHTVARNTEKEKERQKEELEVNRQA